MTRSPRADDDTQTFSGASVESALRAARAAHGPRVEVLRALRVVAGVRGLLGQARYEVVVKRPVPTTVEVLHLDRSRDDARGGDPVSSALDDLLDAAEEREAALAGEEDEAGWTWTQQSEVEDLFAELAERLGPDTPRHPALAVAEHDLLGDDLPQGPPLEAEDADVVLEPAMGAGWDRGELRRLGVPAAVLSRLPVEDPSDDAGWRRALLGALAATVPPPAQADAQHPVVVSGYGLLGAIAVMRAAVEDGATPGTLALDGRHRPATPAAFVEVLAASARS